MELIPKKLRECLLVCFRVFFFFSLKKYLCDIKVKTVLSILCFYFLFFITSNKRHNKITEWRLIFLALLVYISRQTMLHEIAN